MKTIGITQRVDVTATGERRDALDQCWCALLQDLGVRLVPIPNQLGQVPSFVKDLRLEGIILSGGNDIAAVAGAKNAAPERDTLETQLIDYCAAQQIPMLGICRGLQMLVHHYGGKLTPISGHVAIRHSVQPRSDLFPVEPFEVNSFHHFGIATKSLPSALEVLATDVRGNVEAARHKDSPQFGVMWHPEREDVWAAHDLSLLRKVFAL